MRATDEIRLKPGERGYTRQSSDEILESIPFEEGTSVEEDTGSECNSSTDELREEDWREKLGSQQLGQAMAGSTLAQTTGEEKRKTKASNEQTSTPTRWTLLVPKYLVEDQQMKKQGKAEKKATEEEQ